MEKELVAAQWRRLHLERKRKVKDLRRALDCGLPHPVTGERVELSQSVLHTVEHSILRYDGEQGIVAAQQRIADDLGIARKTVNEHLALATAAGILSSELRNREGEYAKKAHMGGRTTNRYRFCWDRILAAIKAARRTVRKYTQKAPFWADNQPSRVQRLCSMPARIPLWIRS